MYETDKANTRDRKDLAKNLALATKALSDAGLIVIGLKKGERTHTFEITCAYDPYAESPGTTISMDGMSESFRA